MNDARSSAGGRRLLSRRAMLRVGGAGIALPLLDSMLPGTASAVPGERGDVSVPRRMVAIHVPLGMMPQFFFPAPVATGGIAAEPSSPYLDLLESHRGRFTVFSGLSHPEVDGNHHAGQCFLTGAPHPGQPTFKNSMSLDQVAAEAIGQDNRFPFLALSVQNGEQYSNTLAVSRSGVNIPAETSPKRLYRAMFVAGTAEEKAATLRRIEAGGSVLDLVLDKKARLERAVGPRDRLRLEQYFSSVRDLEQRLGKAADWEQRPKPAVHFKEPDDIGDPNRVIEKAKLMFDMLRLALDTDSTRVITLSLSTFSVVPHVPGVKNETHGLTHHGNEEAKIAELRKIEDAQMAAFGVLLQGLHGTPDGAGTLLDHTQVLFGSCLGNANSHSNQNLPIILAGGGYKHPGYLAFDRQRNEPLANLFVTMLQKLGVATDRFSSSTGTLRGMDG